MSVATSEKGDAPSLRQLINHVSSHMNVLQALSLNISVQDLMLNHLMLATLDAETQQECELITASRADIPTTTELSHIPGVKMQSSGFTSEHPVTEDNTYHSTYFTSN